MPMASRLKRRSLAEVGVTAPPMAIEVRQATLGDYPAIDAFIREAYEGLAPYKAHDRHRQSQDGAGSFVGRMDIRPPRPSGASSPDGRRTFWAQQTAPSKPHFLANCVG
jgi:hypothetical protein